MVAGKAGIRVAPRGSGAASGAAVALAGVLVAAGYPDPMARAGLARTAGRRAPD